MSFSLKVLIRVPTCHVTMYGPFTCLRSQGGLARLCIVQRYLCAQILPVSVGAHTYSSPCSALAGSRLRYSSDYHGLVALYASAASCAWPQEVLLSVP